MTEENKQVNAVTVASAISAWNAQADQFNQWPNLGEDEKLEWIVGLKLGAASVASGGDAFGAKDESLLVGFAEKSGLLVNSANRWLGPLTKFANLVAATAPLQPRTPAEPKGTIREVEALVVKADLQIGDGHVDAARKSLDKAMDICTSALATQPRTLDAPITDGIVDAIIAAVRKVYGGIGEGSDTAWMEQLKSDGRAGVIRALAAGRAATPGFTPDELQELKDRLKPDHDGSDFEAECPGCTAYRKIDAMLSGAATPQQAIPGDKVEGESA